MNLEYDVSPELNNWGAWLRSMPDPFKHLNYGLQPMFKEWQPPWRESMIDDDFVSRKNEDLAHDVNRAVETDRTVRMLTREDHRVYLYAYFAQWGSKRRIAEEFGESRRNVDVRLAAAMGAYEVLACLRDELKRAC